MKSSTAKYVISADTIKDNILRVAAERHDELGAEANILGKNNEEVDDNLEDLKHADEESEYIVKPGYLQVIRGICGDGSDDDVGDHDAETVRDADEQSEEIPTDQQRSTSEKRIKRKLTFEENLKCKNFHSVINNNP
ncbi:hypothetical protein JTB14_012776 [Gonioctena quinquepunctata]|nr:hypothetical protein JTB14_012776 [Gonioctena quinquepunctata]